MWRGFFTRAVMGNLETRVKNSHYISISFFRLKLIMTNKAELLKWRAKKEAQRIQRCALEDVHVPSEQKEFKYWWSVGGCQWSADPSRRSPTTPLPNFSAASRLLKQKTF